MTEISKQETTSEGTGKLSKPLERTLILKPAMVFGSQANSNVGVGLISCGGRGIRIGLFFPEYTGAKIVAPADVVKKNLAETAAVI
ncbi:MAG: hypothetical protein IPP47_00485 [Bryobacterales bacterium]|nr:hypothetical protein [Bryobacterales bacterium]